MIEIFTQLTAKPGQLKDQYELRKRFCIDYLKWTDRTVVSGMEYDQYDHPATVYFLWRDNGGVARSMLRATQCDLPYMIKDIWPDLVTDVPLPSQYDQWEITRVCVEQEIGHEMVSRSLGELMFALEIFAQRIKIKEYWWMSPKERIEVLVPHNHTYAGKGKQVGYEFCFAGWSEATNLVVPKHRLAFETSPVEIEDAA